MSMEKPSQETKGVSRREFLDTLGGIGLGIGLGVGITKVISSMLPKEDSSNEIDIETKKLLKKSFEQYVSIFLKSNPKTEESHALRRSLKKRFDSILEKYPIVFDPNQNTDANAALANSNKNGVADTLIIQNRILGVQDSIENHPEISDDKIIEASYHNVTPGSHLIFRLLIAEIAHRAHQNKNPKHFEKNGEEYDEYSKIERYNTPNLQEYITHEVFEPALFIFLFQKISTKNPDISIEQCIDKCLTLYVEVTENIASDDTINQGRTQDAISKILTIENITTNDMSYLKDIIKKVGEYTKKTNFYYTPNDLLFSKDGKYLSDLIGIENLLLLDFQINELSITMSVLDFNVEIPNEEKYILSIRPTDIFKDLYKAYEIIENRNSDKNTCYKIFNKMMYSKIGKDVNYENILKTFEFCLNSEENNFDKTKVNELKNFVNELRNN